MKQLTLRLDLLSYWHAGTGRGAEALADAVVLRDRAGLPFLPGRTLKGLVRDAMELGEAAGAVPAGNTAKWLGTPSAGVEGGDEASAQEEPEQRLEASRYKTKPGVLWFGSATLPEAWQRWAASAVGSEREVAESLFTHVASTAIDQDGVATEGTLRVSEVTVPMTLAAVVRGPEDTDEWVKDLDASLPLLRALGTRRHRGYGRVRASLEAP